MTGPGDVLPPESPYGRRTRLEYFQARIAAHDPARPGDLRVLEVGCGTGAMVTKPLARSLPATTFFGLDIHTPSIVEARRDAPANVVFRNEPIECEEAASYDVVICSEVLEHLAHPAAMLGQVKRVLAPGGIALVTIPNGYGPKEIEDLVKRGLIKIFPPLRRLLSSTNHTVASLNPAGHIQFFTMRRFRALVRGQGLRIVDYQGRRFLGGPISSRSLLVTPALRRWNVVLGRALPAWSVSSWMFTLRRV